MCKKGNSTKYWSSIMHLSLIFGHVGKPKVIFPIIFFDMQKESWWKTNWLEGLCTEVIWDFANFGKVLYAKESLQSRIKCSKVAIYLNKTENSVPKVCACITEVDWTKPELTRQNSKQIKHYDIKIQDIKGLKIQRIEDSRKLKYKNIILKRHNIREIEEYKWKH